MSILDELFSAAESIVLEPGDTTDIWISITISPRSPFPGTDMPGNISLGWGKLQYFPAEWVQATRFFGYSTQAYFEGGVELAVDQYNPSQGGPQPSANEGIGVVITGGRIGELGPVPYGVSITLPTGRVSFAPEADPATNVIYGAEGNSFIAISFSGPMQVQNLQ